MTEAKELDPAVRLNALDEAIETLRFNVRHLIAEDDKDDALRTLEVARDVMASVAETLASLPRLEALSTAPVALEVSEERVEAAARAIVASTAPLIADDEHWPVAVWGYREMCGWYPDYADGHSLVTDAFRNARIALSAIHPAPSREAVIDRAAIIEECAAIVRRHPKGLPAPERSK